MKQGASRIGIFSGIFIYCLVTANPTRAQIVPDTTLPINSIVTPQDNTNLIEGGTTAGSNLFHSFEQFSIPTGTQAHFNNSLDIQNIFSRVTGRSISNIDGLLQANGTANLFLLNPNGIIFGPNARLNIGGSFLASTASSLRFADGTQFSATAPQTTPLLTVSVPVGLQFGDTPQRIVANKPVGNPDITIPERVIDRTLFQELPTVSPELIAQLSQLISQLSQVIPELALIQIEELQTIPTEIITQLTPQLIVIEALTRIGNLVEALLISRSGLEVKSGQTLALVGGDIALEGGVLNAKGNVSTPGGRVELGSVTGGSSVSITPTAKGFALSYEGATGFGNINLSRGAFVDISGSGSGEIQVRGDRVTLTDTSAIFATTSGNDNGGEFSIRAGELTVTGNSILGGVTIAQGRSADIRINATNLTVQKGFIGSLSGPLLSLLEGNKTGDAGNLTIEVTDSINLRDALFAQLPSGIFAATGDEGRGGNITISTGRLLARDGAQIAVTTGGTGKAGTIRVNARESIQLIGDSADNLIRSGIFVSSFGSGDAGDIIVESGELTVRGGAAISGATRIGAGGNVTVKVSGTAEVAGTTTVSLVPGAELFSSDISANTLGTGNAGDVFVQAGRLIVRDDARVTTATRNAGTGPAGNLTVDAGSIQLNGGTITAETRQGNFGNITLRSGDLQIRNQSQITTNAIGTGGNITINTDVLAALENSDITANSADSRGGRVTITTRGIFGATVGREPTPTTSDITASSQLGPQFDGVVDIQRPEIDPNQALLKIPPNPEPPREILTACEGTGSGRFVNNRLGGSPLNPTQPLTGEATWVDARRGELGSRDRSLERSQSDRILEAQGWIKGANGEIILTAQALNITPYSSQPTPSGCQW